MTLELPIIEGASVLTHSSESYFKSCPRKYVLRYRLGLQPSHDSDALRIGTAFHAGLESFKRGEGEDAAARTVGELYDDAELPPWLTPEQFDTERHTAIALVRGYCRRYADDMIVEYVAVEQSFELPITNPSTGHPSRTFRSSGKIDGIVRLPDGRLAIVEHKTTGEAIEQGSDYWRRLLMDSQISRYFLAARELGYDVQTIVYDVVRKPQIKPKAIAKADRIFAQQQRAYFDFPITGPCPERETPALYGARLLNDLTTRPEFYFARMEIPRLESDIEEFRYEQWQIAQQIHQADRYGRFYRNTNACLSLGRCQFFDVCRGVSGDPNERIPDGFRRVEHLHEELAVAKRKGQEAA